jgi:DNA ligase-associated metallophosphoesterase
MINGICLEIKDQHLWLLPQKAIFWEEQKMLMLSDLHFGKSTHFRKAGIPVSVKVFQKDLDILSSLLDKLVPSTICFLGDLFHSDINIEFEWFETWMKQYPEVNIELVRGNHDIFPASVYKKAGIKVFPLAVHKGPFVFAHDPQYDGGKDDYVISGHIHPGVQLKGNGRQSLCLPCFYFGKNQALMPAFGEFTGLALIQPKKNDKVFVIGDGKVFAVSTSLPTFA